MSTWLVEYSLKNRPLIVFLGLLLVAFGVRSLGQLPIDAVPDVTNVQVQINTNAPGLSPLEVERFVTFPIEQAMTGLPDIEEIRSLSKYGLSQVTVVFEESVDIYFARQLVFERLQEARAEIPEGMGEPEMGPISTGLGEIYQYQVVGDERWDLLELREVQDWMLKRQLRTVPGVTEVNSFGGFETEYQVVVDPRRLQARGLTFQDLFAALEENNRNAGGGLLDYRDDQLLLRGIGLVEGVSDLEKIVLSEHHGVPVTVGDVARVEKGGGVRQGAVTRDGQGEIVTGIAMMLVGENSRAVARRVDQRLDELSEQLPEGVSVETFYDRTELVDRTVRTVATNLAEGALLVVVVLFALLGNLRAALIVALAIPLSMLFASILMVRFGISGNLMSLGAIDFGLVVDGSVVMVENAVSALAAGGTVLQAAREVARPIFFGVGIIIVVYLPIMTLTGLEGKMFRPMAFTVVFALIGSLILALTLVPVLASSLLKPGAEHELTVVRWLKARYRPLLEWALGRPGTVVAAAFVLFAASLATLPTLGAEFLPELDEGAIAVQAIRIPSISLQRSLEMAGDIEEALLEFPEVTSVISKTGRPDIATDPMGVEISDIFVLLRPDLGDKQDLERRMAERLARIPGMEYGFSQPIELRVEELISGVRSDVALKIFGEDLEVLRESAERAAAALRKVPGAADVRVEQTTGLPYLQIRIEREAVARLGLNVGDVQDVIEIALGRKPAGVVFEGERRFPLVVKLEEGFADSPEAVRSLRIPVDEERSVPLSQVADVRLETGAAQVSREDAQRRIVVEANVRGRDLVSFVRDARRAVEGTIPAGYFTDWGGEFENYERARARLTLVVPIALGLIFFLLYANFGSLAQSLMIFLNVPFAITGGVAALAVRGMPFSISAGVGFIALFGVAVLNGLVLVSAIDQRGGAVVEGCLARLRPVLMTALVASLGFLPMALSHGAGAEVQRPLATVVIGGLVTSTALTLLVIPAVYSWYSSWRSP